MILLLIIILLFQIVHSEHKVILIYLQGNLNEINPESDKELSKTQEAIKSMKAIIKLLMPQIPYFRGYFHILDMITFSIHYIST